MAYWNLLGHLDGTKSLLLLLVKHVLFLQRHVKNVRCEIFFSLFPTLAVRCAPVYCFAFSAHLLIVHYWENFIL